MNKEGYTLVELLFVIVLIAVISVSSVVVFNETSNASEEQENTNTYLDLQRAAKLYLDLNDSWVTEFNNTNKVYISIGELKSKNFVSSQIKNAVTKEDIPEKYLVKVYVTSNGSGYVDTCVIDIETNNKEKCIADSDGNIEPSECCYR